MFTQNKKGVFVYNHDEPKINYDIKLILRICNESF
jgi:hypothetical protein